MPKLVVILCLSFVLPALAANNCTGWSNCKAPCKFGEWEDATIASVGRWAAFNDNCNKAIDIMSKYPGVLSTDRGKIHLTFQYLCCYDLPTFTKYINVIDNYKWHSVNVTYVKAVCNMDKGDPDHTSIIVLLDPPSQKIMSDVVTGFERAMVADAIPLPFNRSVMEPFHSTLGVVNKAYPIDKVLDEINAAIPSWSPVPINLKNFLLITFVHQFRAIDGQLGAQALDVDRNDLQFAQRLLSQSKREILRRAGRFSPASPIASDAAPN